MILSQNTLIYYVDVGNESEMRIFAKLVAKVETAPKLKLHPSACLLFNVSYHFVAVGAPNNHDIAMVIVL